MELKDKEKEVVKPKQKKTAPKKKVVVKKYKVILVADSYIVYEFKVGCNGWMPRPEGDFEIGDMIEI